MDSIQIGVVSDTHCPERVPFSVMNSVCEALAGCDCILHAGDIETRAVLERLEEIAPVRAVRGDDEIDTNTLPEKRVLTFGDVRIGMHHSHRPLLVEMPSRIRNMFDFLHGDPWGGVQDWLLDQFREDDVQIIVFGHFHRPYCAEHDGILLFNPGSIYHLSHAALDYRIHRTESRIRRITGRLEKRSLPEDQTAPLPTVGKITLAGSQIATEIIELPPVDYSAF